MVKLPSQGLLIGIKLSFADDIHYFPPILQPKYDVIGGAGIYAGLGARMFEPAQHSEKVGLVIHTGADFPKPIREWIERFGMRVLFIPRIDSLTTRGQNTYDEFGNRSKFSYLQSMVIHRLLT